jgi:hypothetical protein
MSDPGDGSLNSPVDLLTEPITGPFPSRGAFSLFIFLGSRRGEREREREREREVSILDTYFVFFRPSCCREDGKPRKNNTTTE